MGKHSHDLSTQEAVYRPEPLPDTTGSKSAEVFRRSLPPPSPVDQQKRRPPIQPPPVGSVQWGQMKWVPAARWCQECLVAPSSAVPRPQKTGRKVKRRVHPGDYNRGVIEIFLVLLRILMDAKRAKDFNQAQRKVLDYREQHVPLKLAPVPDPIPTVSFSLTLSDARESKRATQVDLSPAGPPRHGGASPPGEAFGSYNRLPLAGHGRSFEDSVALRQSDKYARRREVDRTDRTSASGSREEYEDLD
jgi:hypothetical protein